MTALETLQTSRSADVHHVLDLVRKVDAQGVQPDRQAEWLELRGRIMRSVDAQGSNDLEGGDEDGLGIWPVAALQVAGFLVGGAMVYEAYGEMKRVSKVLVWAAGAWVLLWGWRAAK